MFISRRGAWGIMRWDLAYEEYDRKFRWYLEQFGPEGDDPLLWYGEHGQGDRAAAGSLAKRFFSAMG